MSAIDPAIVEAAQHSGPSCPECGHLIGAHSHDVGCMDSMMGGLLERDRLGFCPCARSSLGLITDAVKAAETAVREAVEGHFADMGDVWGGSRSWLTTGDHVAELVQECLREAFDEAVPE